MAMTALVNDLDLTVSGPTGSWAFGNNLTTTDETHGARQVEISKLQLPLNLIL